MSAKYRNEFKAYLQACTNSQVYGVLAKEQAAGRRAYVELAQAEILRRSIQSGFFKGVAK